MFSALHPSPQTRTLPAHTPSSGPTNTAEAVEGMQEDLDSIYRTPIPSTRRQHRMYVVSLTTQFLLGCDEGAQVQTEADVVESMS